MIKFRKIADFSMDFMRNRDNLHCGISYIIAGTTAFLGTANPLLDMRNLFPDTYLSVSTLCLLWIPALLISLLGFVNIRRSCGKPPIAWLIASALAGIVLTISSIATGAGAVVYAAEETIRPSWRLGTGGLMLLAAFMWTMVFPIFLMVKEARAKTLAKRVMAGLLDSRAASSSGGGTYWECRVSLR